MPSGRRNTFGKTLACPSTDEVLLFFRQETNPHQQEVVANHVTRCDFCAAELHLLATHPPEPVIPGPVPMPPHLRTLAEGLLVRDAKPRMKLLTQVYRSEAPRWTSRWNVIAASGS
jgi:hypothetical protein